MENERQGGEEEKISPESPEPPFLEVLCKSSSKVRRFAAGTAAGFALYTIKHKLETELPQPSYIEAVKEGEEPVTFGPNAVLVNYGRGWNLQTVIIGNEAAFQSQQASKLLVDLVNNSDFGSAKKPTFGKSSSVGCLYIVKIMVVFAFIFVLAGTFTFFLEYLPRLIPPASS